MSRGIVAARLHAGIHTEREWDVHTQIARVVKRKVSRNGNFTQISYARLRWVNLTGHRDERTQIMADTEARWRRKSRSITMCWVGLEIEDIVDRQFWVFFVMSGVIMFRNLGIEILF